MYLSNDRLLLSKGEGVKNKVLSFGQDLGEAKYYLTEPQIFRILRNIFFTIDIPGF
jgi:hypothetical protein